MDVKWNNSKISYKNLEYCHSHKNSQFEEKKEVAKFDLGMLNFRYLVFYVFHWGIRVKCLKTDEFWLNSENCKKKINLLNVLSYSTNNCQLSQTHF